MALVDNAWYVDFGNGSSTGYYGVGKWTALTPYVAGNIVRQNAAPAVGSERCFVCIIAGTTLASEPSWVTSRGGKKAETAGPTWQECTGIAALNGDASTNTPTWTTYKAATSAATLGQVIQRNNGASFWICSTAGNMGGSEPAWANNTAGTTQADNTATWTCLGVVGNFTGWQAPHALLMNALASTWGQASNKYFLASEHAETQAASLTLTSPGDVSSPITIVCVTKTTVPPVSANVTTGASIATTGNSFIELQGCMHFTGVTLSVGSSSNSQSLRLIDNGSTTLITIVNGALIILNTGAGSILLGNTSNVSGTIIRLKNTTAQFSAAGQGFKLRFGKLIWENTPSAIVSGTLPTVLFNSNGTSVSDGVSLEGVDLSALGSGKTLTDGANAAYYRFKDCKLNASVTITTTPTLLPTEVLVIDCDSGATNYRTEKYAALGTLTTETTIVRTGGASSGTVIAWKIVTGANSKWVQPFEPLPLPIWNTNITTDVTITLYGIWGGGAVPNKDDIWFEAEFLGSASTPQATITTAGKSDVLASSVGWGTDTSTWGGSTTKFKMTLTLSSSGSHPLQVGLIYLYIKAAKASSTFYIDPLPVLS